jgi:hypothetical protein
VDGVEIADRSVEIADPEVEIADRRVEIADRAGLQAVEPMGKFRIWAA